MEAKVTQLCLTLWDPKDYTVHGILQARILEWVAFPSSRGPSQLRDRTQVSLIAGRFFTSWARREVQEYQSGSLSLLQRIFPTQESNWGLLHWRQILYQVSYQGSPPLEKEMATHSSILAWKIPWTEEPGGLQSVGSQRVRHNLVAKQHNCLQLQGNCSWVC